MRLTPPSRRDASDLLVAALRTSILACTGSLAWAGACPSCDDARELLAEGRLEEAESILRESAGDDRKNAEPRGLLVLVLARLERRREAAETLVQCLKRSPSADLVSEIRAALPPEAADPSAIITVTLPEGVIRPVLLFSAGAIYPPAARAAGVEGEVTVFAKIGRDGIPREIDWDRSVLDWPRLLEVGFPEPAMDSVRKWRFFPALRDGAPIDADLQATISFTLIRGGYSIPQP